MRSAILKHNYGSPHTLEPQTCHGEVLFSVFYSTCFQDSLPPPPVQLFFVSSMPFGLKTHLRQLHPSSDLLGFKVPAVSSAAGWVFFLISSFKDQRRVFPEGRGQGEELEKNREYFFFDLCAEIILVLVFSQ